MFNPIKDLLTPAFHLDPSRRKGVVRMVLGISIIMVVATAVITIATATTPAGADSAIWDVVLQSRLALVRIILAIPVVILAVGGAMVAFNAVSHSETGRHLMTWDGADTPEVKARKTGNMGLILAVLLLAFVLGLLGAVLR